MEARNPAQLASALESKLLTYAKLATSAGIGLVALGQSATASVVYTPADVRIGGAGLMPYSLDVNHDGRVDCEFIPYSYAHFDQYVVLYAVGAGLLNSGGSFQAAKDKNQFDAAARKAGGAIGPQKEFDKYTRMGAAHSDFYGNITQELGSWVNVKRRYLGLKFKIGSETHYGWARFNVGFVVKDHLVVRAKLTGYAYETEPDKPIAAGDQGAGESLGHLALGPAAKH